MYQRTVLAGILGRVGTGVLALSVWGSAQAVGVVAHPQVVTSILPLSSARTIFGMRLTQWPDGVPVRVFVLSDQHPLHVAFCKEVLQIYPYQLRQAWDRMASFGSGRAPVVLDSEAQMIAQIATTPGGIGYASSDHGLVRVIQVRDFRSAAGERRR